MTQIEAPYVEQYRYEQNREIVLPEVEEPLLGPFKLLPGTWRGEQTGWNMIALPFKGEPDSRLDYRLLLNQFDETLIFSLVDKNVPNRGLDDAHTVQTDQSITALDYEQSVSQVFVVDRPASTVAGAPNAAIHHEPGLFLNMLTETGDGPTVARLATIPHGDAALALGNAFTVDGPPRIPPVDGLPIGVPALVGTPPIDNPYLEPYTFFRQNPFLGTFGAGFPGFDPTQPHLLLELINQGKAITRTTVIDLDTAADPGGIHNIPFVVKQANAVSMKSIFWINEYTDGEGNPALDLQYLQIVMLDFFPRRDGSEGLISWPHVSINTLTKVSDTPAPYEAMTTA